MSIPESMIELRINTSEFYRAREAIRLVNDGNTWRGMFKEFITDALKEMTEYARKITPKQSGNLARAHMWDYDSRRMSGSIFINPRAVWLESRSTIRWPKVYGVYVHGRGGASAFYQRTIDERANKILVRGLLAKVRDLPWP